MYTAKRDKSNDRIRLMARWLDPQPVKTNSLETLILHPLVAQTLLRRGITTIEAVQAFLHPDSIPSTPFPDIGKVVEVIELAIRREEMICVVGAPFVTAYAG